MNKQLIKAEFDGGLMQFNADGWFNATVAAVEIHNGAMIAVGTSYEDRKTELVRLVAERRAKALGVSHG